MKIRPGYFSLFFFSVFITLNSVIIDPAQCEQVPKCHIKQAKEDFTISPYTGYTHSHWLEITERITRDAVPSPMFNHMII